MTMSIRQSRDNDDDVDPSLAATTMSMSNRQSRDSDNGDDDDPSRAATKMTMSIVVTRILARILRNAEGGSYPPERFLYATTGEASTVALVL